MMAVRIVTAKLKQHKTADGLYEFYEEVPLGKEYTVDIGAAREMVFWNRDHERKHTKMMVPDVKDGGWLPLECLEVQES